MDRYRQVNRDFIASLGSRANLALAHITPRDVLTYRNSIIAAKKTARTANLSIKVVSGAVYLCAGGLRKRCCELVIEIVLGSPASPG
jgi:hypothetical protein